MDIRNTRALKSFAAQQLESARDEKKIVLYYGCLVIGLAALVTVARYALSLQIDQTGGLSQIGTRSRLSALNKILPIVQSLLAMCLEVGYMSAMLRIARGQYASPNSLRLGFDRFWTLLRCSLIQGLLYTGIFLTGTYLAAMIFLATSWGRSFMEILTPIMADASLLSGQLVLDDATALALADAMMPMMLIAVIVSCLLILPFAFQFRMANYVIIDKPGLGAFAALLESRKMMKGNCLKLLKLDLSWWWYFLVLLVINMVGNADLLLELLGIPLPISADAAYFLFFAVYLALLLAVYYFLRNRMEVTYALAYDAVKPEEPKPNGVVLGNIFDLYRQNNDSGL